MKQFCGHDHRNRISHREVPYSASVKPGDLITQATLFRLRSVYEHATEWHKQRPNI
jgi:hypothetical protein